MASRIDFGITLLSLPGLITTIDITRAVINRKITILHYVLCFTTKESQNGSEDCNITKVPQRKVLFCYITRVLQGNKCLTLQFHKIATNTGPNFEYFENTSKNSLNLQYYESATNVRSHFVISQN